MRPHPMTVGHRRRPGRSYPRQPVDRLHCPPDRGPLPLDRPADWMCPPGRPASIVAPSATIQILHHQAPTAVGPPSRAADCAGSVARRGGDGEVGPDPHCRWPTGASPLQEGPSRAGPSEPREAGPLLRARALPRGGPNPGMSGRPGMRSRGNRLPGARRREETEPARRSSGDDDRGLTRVRPGHPRTLRMGRLERRRRWGALAQSSRR
jgi:hypothetical protein